MYLLPDVHTTDVRYHNAKSTGRGRSIAEDDTIADFFLPLDAWDCEVAAFREARVVRLRMLLPKSKGYLRACSRFAPSRKVGTSGTQRAQNSQLLPIVIVKINQIQMCMLRLCYL